MTLTIMFTMIIVDTKHIELVALSSNIAAYIRFTKNGTHYSMFS